MSAAADNRIFIEKRSGKGAGASTKVVALHAELIQHAEIKVTQRHLVMNHSHVLELTVLKSAASENHGQVAVGVRVGVTHAAAEQD